MLTASTDFGRDLEPMLKHISHRIVLLIVVVALLPFVPATCWAFASANIPLDSPIYFYLEKLAGFGLVTGDVRGIRPYSRLEAARLLVEAEDNLAQRPADAPLLAQEITARLHELLPREHLLARAPAGQPWFDYELLSSFRLRYGYLRGAPRSFERPVHDPGGDGFFGIGAGLRPDNPYPSPVQQHGSEGTPLLENNEGLRFHAGSNYETRFSSEAYFGGFAAALVEPLLSYSAGDGSPRARLNKGYVKLGGAGLELEVGRDANWLGLGHRGAITLTDNARNFDMVKLSSPEPIRLRYVGDIKYAFIFSRFDRTVVNGQERQPYFFAGKLSVKPVKNFEAGLNLGRQQGGPGVHNSLGSTFRGLYGGTDDDNSNSLAGFELRLRLPFLRHTEIYAEDSFEDMPSVESYLAGFYIPRLSESGRDDLRFEYFRGNRILYTNHTFPEGYLYRGLPIGHSQGGATEDFFVRYSHWFSPRNSVALEYLHTSRGTLGRVPVDAAGSFKADGVMQAIERKNAWRAFWNLPLYGIMDLNFMYGWERVKNFNLVGGAQKTNQLFKADLSYRY
jgi:capsule assembly protein Wzi